jgi:hypothetical protein
MTTVVFKNGQFQTEDGIVDLEHEKDVLKAKIRELEDWKDQELAVWGPVIDYFHHHGECHGLKLGQSISKFIINHFANQTQ